MGTPTKIIPIRVHSGSLGLARDAYIQLQVMPRDVHRLKNHIWSLGSNLTAVHLSNLVQQYRRSGGDRRRANWRRRTTDRRDIYNQDDIFSSWRVTGVCFLPFLFERRQGGGIGWRSRAGDDDFMRPVERRRQKDDRRKTQLAPGTPIPGIEPLRAVYCP